jgi:hypothetical protein
LRKDLELLKEEKVKLDKVETELRKERGKIFEENLYLKKENKNLSKQLTLMSEEAHRIAITPAGAETDKLRKRRDELLKANYVHIKKNDVLTDSVNRWKKFAVRWQRLALSNHEQYKTVVEGLEKEHQEKIPLLVIAGHAANVLTCGIRWGVPSVVLISIVVGVVRVCG